jgi:hypothetical protein
VPTRAQAFVTQAGSDLAAFEALSKTTLPTCHRLHYLQMWLEKLCKAYLWLPSGAPDLRGIHNVVAKVLPRMIGEHWRRIGFVQRPNLSLIRALCREIDLLQPTVDDGGRRPDNVEYPWIDSNGVECIPSTWTFPIASRLQTNPGRLLVKAATVLTQKPTIFV